MSSTSKMPISRHTRKREKTTDRCARCGACLSFCPVYQVQPIERYSPRGKNFLLRSASIKKRQRLIKQTVTACLQCGACSRLCSSGTDVADLIRRERNKDTYFRSFPHSLFDIWERIGQDRGVKAVSLLEKLSPLSKEFRSPISIASRPFLSNLNLYAKLFQDSVPKCRIDDKAKKAKILLFCGCMQNYVFPDIAAKIAALLDWEIEIPTDQVCCGLPAYSQGAISQARTFAKKNLNIFSKSDAEIILTGCASCAHMIKNWPCLFENANPLYQYAIKTATRVMELSQFIDQYQTEAIANEDITLAVQIPCHQRYGLDSARSLISATQKFLPPDIFPIDTLGCCGFGGTFSLLNPKLSKNIFEQNITVKIKSFTLKKIDMVLTTCSGCLFRLRYAFKALGKNEYEIPQACHLVDLIVKKGE